MAYILLSIVLFSFNNIVWKKNLQHTVNRQQKVD